MKLVVADSLQGEDNKVVDTPFGAVAYQQTAAYTLLPLTAAPPALAYAARALGAERVLVVLRDTGVAAPTAPSDFVEFTNGRFTTFFAKIGTGYVQQAPPFCPELRSALLQAEAADGGNLLIVDKQPGRAVRQWWHEHDITLISTRSQPEGSLCRELEMCFAVVAVPQAMNVQEWVTAVASHLPTPRTCDCGNSMALARKMGRLPEDWHEWLEKQ